MVGTKSSIQRKISTFNCSLLNYEHKIAATTNLKSAILCRCSYLMLWDTQKFALRKKSQLLTDVIQDGIKLSISKSCNTKSRINTPISMFSSKKNLNFQLLSSRSLDNYVLWLRLKRFHFFLIFAKKRL